MKIQDLPELPVDPADLLPVVFVDDNPRKIGRDHISFLAWKPAGEPPNHRGECIVVMNDGFVLAARYLGGPKWYNGHHCWEPSGACDSQDSFTENDFICWSNLPDAPAFALPEIQGIAQQCAVNDSYTSAEL